MQQVTISEADRAALASEVIELLSALNPDRTGKFNARERLVGVSYFSALTLNMIKALIGTEHGNYVYNNLVNGSNMPEREVQDYCMLASDANMESDALADTHLNRFSCFSYVRGFGYYDGLEPITEHEYPSFRLSQINAIVRVTEHLQVFGYKVSVETPDKPTFHHFITDEGIRNLLLTSDSPEHVADIIVKRDILKAEDIKQILSAGSELPSSLRTGVI